MSYLPRREAEFKDYGLRFGTLTKADATAYGLTELDATQIDNAAKDFAAKYDLAMAVETRNAGTIHNKDVAKVTLTSILRGYAMHIKRNPAVAADAKIYLGVGIYDFVRTPVQAPLSRPAITIGRVDARQHRLTFADANPEVGGKPVGVKGLQVFCHVGDAPPAEPLNSRFQTLVTRRSLTMSFQPGDVGKNAYYYARWYIDKGLVGPWSQQASMSVAG